MTECTSCQEKPVQIQWRDEGWCIDCFESEARRREADDDWLRRVLGATAKPTFEPPLDATAVGYDSRLDLLADHTVLERETARVRALSERGLSQAEIADKLGIDPSAVERRHEQIAEGLQRAHNTIEMLDSDGE